MTALDVLRYGEILVDIKTPYSNKRIYCVRFNKKYYEIVFKDGINTLFKALKRKPKHLKEWQGLSYNRMCNKFWMI